MLRLLYAILPKDVPIAFIMLNPDILVWRVINKEYYSIAEGVLTIDSSFNNVVLSYQYVVRIEREPSKLELMEEKFRDN